jgi:hypothetical protein
MPDYINQSVKVKGKVWRFDFDLMLGPSWIGVSGKVLENQNPPRAVWDEFDRWLEAQKPTP